MALNSGVIAGPQLLDLRATVWRWLDRDRLAYRRLFAGNVGGGHALFLYFEERLAGLTIEKKKIPRFGDLRDRVSLNTAVRGCDRIYHCAALLSTMRGREREIYACNVLGTRNLLAAARDAGVVRVVVTGSLSAIGHDPYRPVDEQIPFYPFGKQLPYSHTKALVEHECLKAMVDGLDTVIATSTAIVGPNGAKEEPYCVPTVCNPWARSEINGSTSGLSSVSDWLSVMACWR